MFGLGSELLFTTPLVRVRVRDVALEAASLGLGRRVLDTSTPSYPYPNPLRSLRPSSPTRRSAPRTAAMGASQRCSLGQGLGLSLLRPLVRVRVRFITPAAARFDRA